MSAARELLVAEGYAAVSVRAIAARAGVNQALVHYHFGGVQPLLLAALDESSGARLAAYRAAVEGAVTIADVLGAVEPLFAEDVESGHMTLVTELVAASLGDAELRKKVVARAAPWRELAEQSARRFFAGTPLAETADELASLAVALGLGVNMVARLELEGADLRKLSALGSLLAGFG